MPVPDFSPGEVLTAAAMDSVGLWLVKTQTVGSGVSSVTVTGAFSGNYENYKIIYSGGTASAAQAMAFRFGPSSVSGYNTNYNYVADIRLYGTAAQTLLFSNSATRWDYVGESNANVNQINIDVLQPNLPKWSIYSGGYQGINNSGTTGGVHKNAFAYTDFEISVSGTLTGGTIRVYGYRD